jgi:hypothetical protein
VSTFASTSRPNVPSWDSPNTQVSIVKLIEECRDKWDAWLKTQKREVQLSLLDPQDEDS